MDMLKKGSCKRAGSKGKSNEFRRSLVMDIIKKKQ